MSGEMVDVEGAAVEAPAGAEGASSVRLASPTLRRWVVGHDEAGLLGDGWYQRAREARCGIVYRPAHAEAALLRLPPIPRRGMLRLLLYASPSLLGGAVAVEATLHHAGAPARDEPDERVVWNFESDLWCWRTLAWEVKGRVGEEGATVSLATRPSFVPDAHFANGDHRPMGIYLAAAILERP